MASGLEAKICVLGAQGVGKTSLVQRYVHGTFTPSKTVSTVGAAFLTKRTIDIDSGSTVRLQIWDTAGQERFHSITKLYYRGASAVILVYSIADEKSFVEMGRWLHEVKQNLGDDIILHVVGTKTDIVAQDPSLRQVPYERCIAFIAENLHSSLTSSTTPLPPSSSAGSLSGMLRNYSPAAENTNTNKRSSGFWGNDIGWDVCHEISASSGEGIEEVFRVITRKIVEKASSKSKGTSHADSTGRRRAQQQPNDKSTGYFDRQASESTYQDSRPGIGIKRKSWLLGFPTPNIRGSEEVDIRSEQTEEIKGRKGGCC